MWCDAILRVYCLSLNVNIICFSSCVICFSFVCLFLSGYRPAGRAHYRVVRPFPALQFDVTTMSLASRIEHQEALLFAYNSQEEKKKKEKKNI